MYACARIHYYIYYTWKDTYHLPLSAPLIPLENAEKGRKKKEEKERKREERKEGKKKKKKSREQKRLRKAGEALPGLCHTQKKETRLISETGLPL